MLMKIRLGTLRRIIREELSLHEKADISIPQNKPKKPKQKHSQRSEKIVPWPDSSAGSNEGRVKARLKIIEELPDDHPAARAASALRKMGNDGYVEIMQAVKKAGNAGKLMKQNPELADQIKVAMDIERRIFSLKAPDPR